jgi:hypothetical protein
MALHQPVCGTDRETGTPGVVDPEQVALPDRSVAGCQPQRLPGGGVDEYIAARHDQRAGGGVVPRRTQPGVVAPMVDPPVVRVAEGRGGEAARHEL